MVDTTNTCCDAVVQIGLAVGMCAILADGMIGESRRLTSLHAEILSRRALSARTRILNLAWIMNRLLLCHCDVMGGRRRGVREERVVVHQYPEGALSR